MTRGLALSRVLVVTFSLIVWARGHEKHFTIEELLHSKFSTRISEDIYLDPCKAGGFQGDIALPNVRYELEYELQRRQDQAAEELAKLKEELHDAEGEDDRDDLDDEANPVTTVDPDHDTGILLITSNTVVPTTTDQPLNGTIMKKPPTMKGPRLSSARKRRRQRKKSKSRRKLSQKKELEKLKKELEALKAKIHQLSSEEKKEDDDGGIDEEEVAPVEKTPKGKQTSSVSSRRRKSRRRSRTGSKSKASTTKNTTSESLDALYEGLLNNVTMLSSSGDLVSRSSRRRRAATARKERVWDFGVIPYEIDANFSGAHKALFKQAMRHWENFTCVKFVERTPDHQHYIVFTERTCGCCSFVGKRGNGPQAISIGKNCDKFGIVVHELGHVVGFWHEHTRPDRDDHVHIIRENIMPGQEYNFNKLTSEEVNSLGLSYDFDSIMHYARNTFSKGTYLDTILPQVNPGTKSRPEIGQRIRLSEGDIAQTNMLYKCSRCGRTFQENKGLFTSPNYPLSSPPEEGERCEWRITATHGERIVLNITELDIFKGETCKYDYLEIRDGYWHRSPLLGRFCGNFRITDTIVSTGSRMLVTYQTSNKQTGHRGFSAHYEALCGGDLETDSGHLESPNYPDDYQSNKECIWRITVPADYQVALRFQSFEIENHDNCVYDYLEIRDGLEPTSKLIGVYCGYKVPDDIKSTGNKMYIKFVSDSSVQKAGFSAYFLKEFDECATLDHGCDHSCINLLGGYECQCKIGFELHSDGKRCEDACGGVIETTNGTIVSPSFPELYPVNKHCVWEIIAPPQYRITLNFTHFDLEGNNQDCEYDHVAIKSKMSESELRNHGAFCGPRLPPVITSEGNSLRISFVSDNTVQKTGFAAVFFTDKDECASNNGGCQHECRNTIGSYVCSCHNGFTLHENGHDCKEGGCKHEITAPFGEILSPNYPDYYPSRKDCIWHFTTTPGHRIKLVFNEFELEPHQECAYDHISIYDGDSSDATTLGKFCGSKVPHPISASSNQMFMVFKSDASVQRKGFQAIHATVCGGHLQATSNVKHFYSHSKYGDQNYDNKEDCDWVIEAPLGTNVHLTFLTFEIEDEQECGYDFVEVFAGFDDSGASYGRFCGNTIPPEIISVNEAILVRFRSDDTINNKGFSASYVAIDESENEDIPKLLLS